MPPEKTWIHRLSAIIEVIRASDQPHLNRQDIETLFHVSRRRAHRIMHSIGSVTRGSRGTLTLPRSTALSYLTRFQASDEYQWIIRRKEKLNEHLRVALAESRQKRVQVKINPRVRLTTFDTLTGVILSPGSLQISFAGVEDLLQKLGAFSQAISNEWSDFVRLATGEAPTD